MATLTEDTEYTNASETPLSSGINYWCNSEGVGVNSEGDTLTTVESINRLNSK